MSETQQLGIKEFNIGTKKLLQKDVCLSVDKITFKSLYIVCEAIFYDVSNFPPDLNGQRYW